jgi:hypothetical protein
MLDIFKNFFIASPKTHSPVFTVIPVDTLLLVGNMDPEVTLEMVSQSAEFVSR